MAQADAQNKRMRSKPNWEFLAVRCDQTCSYDVLVTTQSERDLGVKSTGTIAYAVGCRHERELVTEHDRSTKPVTPVPWLAR